MSASPLLTHPTPDTAPPLTITITIDAAHPQARAWAAEVLDAIEYCAEDTDIEGVHYTILAEPADLWKD